MRHCRESLLPQCPKAERAHEVVAVGISPELMSNKLEVMMECHRETAMSHFPFKCHYT